MRQSAVVLARTIGFIENSDLLSGVTTSTSELIQRLTRKYAFKKSPETIEELDITKGISFLEGESEDPKCPIIKLIFWSTGITVETRFSTEVSRAILEKMLEWGAKEFGLNYSPGAIKRFAYVSDVTFFSDAPLLAVNPAVSALATRTGDELSRIWGEPIEYVPLSVRVGHDPLTRKYSIAHFTIEHRAETKFSDHKYYSEAPLPTTMHWDMLEQYEKDIMLHASKAVHV